MARWHLRSNRSSTGAKNVRIRKKKRRELGTLFVETQIAKRKSRDERTFGGNRKIRLASADAASVSDKGKATKTRILSVKENASNPHYVRRNIITKGAVIETELGMAKVTSRPGQHGVINAVLVKKK